MGEVGLIYAITCTATGRRYVGSTVDYPARRRRHLHQLRRGNHHSKFLQREYSKHGSEAIEFSIVIDGVPIGDLITAEAEMIRSMRPEYNGAQPGPTRRGAKQTAACKAKVAEANKGRRHTAEAKAKIAAASMGNKHGEGNTNRLKVTADMRAEILSLRAEGIGCRRLAVMFGVDKKTIHNVYHGNYKSEV